MALFFGNKDLQVTIEKASKVTLGKLDKILIATNEVDLDPIAISGSDALAELEKALAGKQAPLLIDAVKVAIGQEDNSGNKLVPSYLFVIGKGITGDDNTELYNAISEFEKEDMADFYGVACCFEDPKFEEWAQSYANNHLYGTIAYADRVITDKGKSLRIFGFKTETTNNMLHIALLARFLFANRLIGAKFKKLNGVSTDKLTDGAVDLMTKAGWNGYRNVRGKAQVTGSICTDATSHLDEIYVRDTIIYNVANSLMDMFTNEEIVPMGFDGKKIIKAYMNNALNYCGSLGLIEKGEDGRYLFEVNIPDFTSNMKSMRELMSDDFMFTFSPNIPLEKISIRGKEILDWTGGAQ